MTHCSGVNGWWLALIQTGFHVSDRFWAREIRHPKNWKTIFFKEKFYSLKAHAHYLPALIYFGTWRAAKLGIFTHFTLTNLPQCGQRINSLIYVYSIQIPSCFLCVLDHRRDRTSSHYCRPKRFSVLPLRWSTLLS